MEMKRLRAGIATIAAVLFVAGCGGGSPADPPADIRVVPGDSVATVYFTATPGVDYMLFRAATSSMTKDNFNTFPEAKAYLSVVSPKVVAGLVNGTTYSFVLAGSKNGGPDGPGTLSVSAIPRLAGGTWNIGAPLGSNDLRGIAFGTVLVAVGAKGAMFTSTDGINWTALSAGVSTDLNAAVYGANYVAAGAGGVILLSSDAITWTSQVTGTTNDLYAVATNGTGVFVAAGANGTIIVSTNGTSWTAVNSGTSNHLYGVSYGNGVYVAVGANGTLLASTDAINWQAMASQTALDLKRVAYGAVPTAVLGTFTPTFVAVGAAGTLVTSVDGLNWALRAPMATDTVNAVTYATQFMAVGNNGGVFSSTDGTNWQRLSSGTASNLYAIGYAFYGYFGVGTAGTNLSAF
jgi:hypothetical protein